MFTRVNPMFETCLLNRIWKSRSALSRMRKGEAANKLRKTSVWSPNRARASSMQTGPIWTTFRAVVMILQRGKTWKESSPWNLGLGTWPSTLLSASDALRTTTKTIPSCSRPYWNSRILSRCSSCSSWDLARIWKICSRKWLKFKPTQGWLEIPSLVLAGTGLEVRP